MNWTDISDTENQSINKKPEQGVEQHREHMQWPEATLRIAVTFGVVFVVWLIVAAASQP